MIRYNLQEVKSEEDFAIMYLQMEPKAFLFGILACRQSRRSLTAA